MTRKTIEKWESQLNRTVDLLDTWIKSRQGFYVVYTVLFIMLAILIYSIFPLNGKTTIWFPKSEDAWGQYLKSYVFSARWKRDLIEGLLGIKQVGAGEFALGAGFGEDASRFNQLSDPIMWILALVPAKGILTSYFLLRLLRLYLGGIAFMSFCVYMKNAERAAIICGAFLYIFSEYGLVMAGRHPQFGVNLYLLPWLLLGIEKLLQEKKPWAFIGACTVTLMTGVYGAYILAVLSCIYLVVRIIVLNKGRKAAISCMATFAVLTFLCVMISGIFVIPDLLELLNSPRVTRTYDIDGLYTPGYYLRLLNDFVSTGNVGNYQVIGMGGFSILAVLLLLLKKGENKETKIFLLLGTIFLLFPFFGSALNGFSYVINRWIFAFNMLLAYIFVCEWSILISISKKQALLLALGTSIFLILGNLSMVFSFMSINANTIFQLLLAMFAIVIALVTGGKNFTRLAINILVLVSIVCNSYYAFSPSGSNVISQYMPLSRNLPNKLLNTESKALKKLFGNTDFYRYTGNSLTKNGGLLDGVSSTDYFHSLVNPSILEFFLEFGFNNDSQRYSSLNDSTVLNELASVKYYVSDGAGCIPYGYSVVENVNRGEDSLEIWENTMAMPLGYTYSSYFLRDEYEKLSYVQRQEVILRSAVVDSPIASIYTGAPDFMDKTLSYKVVPDKNISIDNKTVKVSKKNAKLSLEFQGEPNTETFLCLKNLDYQEEKPSLDNNETVALARLKKYYNFVNWRETVKYNIDVTGSFGKERSVLKKITYRSPKEAHYYGVVDHIIDFGYSKTPLTKVTITFPVVGTYSFDDISIVCLPLKGYEEAVSALKEDVLKDIDLHNQNRSGTTSLITGNIDLSTPKLLCISLPYSMGWKAYVDGDQKEILKVNTMFMGLALEPGNHKIRLEYHTPGRSIGTVLTCIGFMLLAGIWWYDRRRSHGKF